MQIGDLGPARGARQRSKKVGRGIGSGKGKTCGRGHKGHLARGRPHLGFEGGQTPLHRRLPQLRGFKPVNRIEYAVINVGKLEALEAGTEVTPQTMFALGFMRHENEPVKVLGDGELTKSLTVRAHKFSQAAIAKIQAAGGTAEEL
ncbi:MAG: 50S ribosomal protein L15 [Chthonomonadales bacterium]|nr:50S ribosomal protein L15 [Chthonomonadales bacterium]